VDCAKDLICKCTTELVLYPDPTTVTAEIHWERHNKFDFIVQVHSLYLNKNENVGQKFRDRQAEAELSTEPLSNLNLRSTLTSVQPYPLSNLNLCPTLPSVQPYSLSNLNLCPTLPWLCLLQIPWSGALCKSWMSLAACLL